MALNSGEKPSEDDDVILYMDELPSRNGLRTTRAESLDELPSRNGPRTTLAESLDERTVTSIEAPREVGANKPHHLETDNVNNRKHEYEAEIEDIEPELPGRREHHPGIDDGLTDAEDERHSKGPSSPHPRPVDFPGFGFPVSVTPTPDMNIYQQKKTIAQGMMDLALISANANQFRYVLQSSDRHPYYYPSLAMIGMSLFLQVVVGIGLIWNSRYNVKEDAEMCKANRANNWTVIAIFLVTILNVFISSFGVVGTSEIVFTANTGSGP